MNGDNRGATLQTNVTQRPLQVPPVSGCHSHADPAHSLSDDGPLYANINAAVCHKSSNANLNNANVPSLPAMTNGGRHQPSEHSAASRLSSLGSYLNLRSDGDSHKRVLSRRCVCVWVCVGVAFFLELEVLF